jgi:hypothetical protein
MYVKAKEVCEFAKSVLVKLWTGKQVGLHVSAYLLASRRLKTKHA